MGLSLNLLRESYYAAVPSTVQKAILVRRRAPHWRRAGIVFIHVPKSAGTSISLMLYGSFLGHLTVGDIMKYGSEAVRSLPRFAIVRNPWDRLVSAWRFARGGGAKGNGGGAGISQAWRYEAESFATFERFVEEWLVEQDLASIDPVFRPQTPFVLHGGEPAVDFLGRFESLASTQEFIESVTGRPATLRHVNRSGDGESYRSHYPSQRLINLVGDLYAEDVASFNYSP